MSLYVDIEKKLGTFTLRAKLTAGEEVLSLLGPSGCGKSMILRCIAGIQRPDRGRILLDGQPLFDSEKDIDLPPQKRRVGLLFQSYALFPNMTVERNIAVATLQGSRRADTALVARLLERFGLSEQAGLYPAQLSGGQQQRTALARLLASRPRALLLDEPFSALDSHLRRTLEQDLRRTLSEFGRTALLVSHDRDEVYRLSHSVAVMDSGHVEMLGSRDLVFSAPATKTAALLTGWENLSPVEWRQGLPWAADWNLPLSAAPTEARWVGVRAAALAPGPGGVPCRVEDRVQSQHHCTVYLRPEGARRPLVWDTPCPPAPGALLSVELPANALLWGAL